MKVASLVAGLSLLVAVASPARANPVPVSGQTLLDVPVRSMLELRFKNVVRQANDLSCGAAAMATLVTNYYGQKLTEQEAIQAMMEVGEKEKIEKDGFSLLEMKRYAEKLGYVSAGYRIAEAQRLVNLKVPAIALITVRGYAHFVVIKGVANGEVFIADPAFGNRSRSLEDFAKEWNNVILVVLSGTRAGQSAFTLDPMLRAPASDVMLLLDRALRGVGRGAGEF